MHKNIKKMQRCDMKRLIGEIDEYIGYLKNEYSLSISVHVKESCIGRYKYFEKILPYNTHLNPYCIAVKRNRFKECILCQKRVHKKCEALTHFIGECHAGVREYIFAITKSGEEVGFISVSGYKGFENAPQGDKLYERSMLHEQIPEELLNAVIPPLARMVELLFSEEAETDSGTFQRIKAFVTEHHTNITLEMICEKFHFSKSYISHTFKANTGLTIKSYCNSLKINDAKSLLENSGLSVTDIALTVGFSDLSYFISTFKATVGTTPLAYRKRLGE